MSKHKLECSAQANKLDNPDVFGVRTAFTSHGFNDEEAKSVLGQTAADLRVYLENRETVIVSGNDDLHEQSLHNVPQLKTAFYLHRYLEEMGVNVVPLEKPGTKLFNAFDRAANSKVVQNLAQEKGLWTPGPSSALVIVGSAPVFRDDFLTERLQPQPKHRFDDHIYPVFKGQGFPLENHS